MHDRLLLAGLNSSSTTQTEKQRTSTMKLSDVFTSNYLKAADLKGKEPTAQIAKIVYEEVGQERERRLVMYFEKVKKGMILNKTNAMNVGDHYGDDTDTWAGKPVTLYAAWVDFQGRSTQALRLRVPTASGTAVRETAAAAVVNTVEPVDFGSDDEDLPW
jgi:hypothetical protein